MNRIKSFFLTLILLLGLNVQSQVFINEYSAANYSGIDFQTGPGTAYEDWIEFYNAGSSAVNLAGYYLTDKLTNLQKWQFPAGVTIPANGFLVVLASSENAFMNNYQNTNFKLTQTKGSEYIILSNTSGIIVDSIKLNYANQTNHSRGRTTNGAATWAVFDSPTLNAANINAKTKYADKVTFNFQPGFYTGAQSITLSTTEPSASIRYTINGSVPTTASNLYSGPINVSATTVIRARAYSTNPLVLSSHTETNTYFINEVHSVKVISVCGNSVANLFNGSQTEPQGSLELFETDGTFLTEATGQFNKHGNDSWAYNQRGVDFIARDQFGINYALVDEIFDNKNRDEFQRIILKCGASDNYPFENGGAHIRDAYVNEMSQLGGLSLDERSNEFAVLYLNGNYWGVYDVREKTDDNDFTDYYYNQDVPYIQYLKTWGGTWEEFGAPNAQNDWDALVSFIDLNNMQNAANYNYVDSVYNTGSLIDYFILNGFVVCSDWLNWNTGWWRGLNPAGDKKKWRYTLWDMDATFGHYINYTGIPNQSANADPCDPESLGDPGGQGHVPIWNKLQANDDFFADYINRYAELSSTVFTCDSMHNLLDAMVAEIQPEMQRHINRWGGTFIEWQSNVQDIHDFIDTRCVNVPAGLVNCNPELSGPYNLIIDVDPPLSGEVQLSSLTPSIYPYSGTYFGGVNISLDADPFTNWVFDYWTIANDTLLPDSLTENVLLTLSANDTIVAHFAPDVIVPQDTLTFIVSPAGAGTVTINGTLQSTFPFTANYNDGSLMTLNAQANVGFAFNNWVMGNHLPSPNSTSSNVIITLGSNDTIYLNFNVVSTDTITYIVTPAGTGNINVNSVLQSAFPFTDSYSNSATLNLAALANAGFTFSNWSMTNNTVNPNNTSTNVTVNLVANDTIYANFNLINEDTIVYIVNPIASGSITLNGSLLTPLPFTNISLNGSSQLIDANANLNYAFSYWEATNNNISNINASSSDFISADNDTIIAHFNLSLEDTLVVITIPNGAGTLNVGGDVISTSPFTGVYPLAAVLNIGALANTGNNFNRWELNNQSLPDYNPVTSFVFINQDTLFAYFDTPTFIQDLGADFENFSVYPTINEGSFTIAYELKAQAAVVLNLMNAEGRLVANWTRSNQHPHYPYKEVLNFEGSDGMYILNIRSSQTNTTQKIIKISK